MNIDSIHNGVVIDHITAGHCFALYEMLNLGELDYPVALIKNVESKKMGRKDIIKVDADIELNLDVIGYAEPGATVNIIKNEKLVEKKVLELPEKLTNVIKCKNPRFITSTEQELPHIFKLTDRENRVYRCAYCETKAQEN